MPVFRIMYYRLLFNVTGASSMIDHLIVSKTILDDIANLDVIDSGANLCEHWLIIMHLKFKMSPLVVTKSVFQSRMISTSYGGINLT